MFRKFAAHNFACWHEDVPVWRRLLFDWSCFNLLKIVCLVELTGNYDLTVAVNEPPFPISHPDWHVLFIISGSGEPISKVLYVSKFRLDSENPVLSDEAGKPIADWTNLCQAIVKRSRKPILRFYLYLPFEVGISIAPMPIMNAKHNAQAFVEAPEGVQ
jgi:hypothetical protein